MKFLFRAALLALTLCSLNNAQASLTQISIFQTNFREQTSGSTSNSTGYVWDVRADVDSAADFDSGTISFPGAGSPQALSLQPGPLWNASSSFATAAELSAAYPTGTYTVTLENSVTANSEQGVVNYTADAWPASSPRLTSSSYNGAQGMDAHSGFTFNFTSFNVGAGNPDESFVFFTLYDYTLGALAYDAGFLNASTTSVSLAADTLLAGHQYGFDLIFSNRLQGYDSVNDVFTTQGWDVRTLGTFTTAVDNPVVPEPASMALVALGCCGMAAVRRRRVG